MNCLGVHARGSGTTSQSADDPSFAPGESLALVAEPDNAGMIQRALAPDGINLVHASGAAAWQTIIHFHST